MKRPGSDLHALITSLNLSEKRYCSLYLAKHSNTENNRYLKLFNVLKSQKEYDTQNAAEQCGFNGPQSSYPVLKKQLYEQILNALHQYDIFNNPEQQLLRGINQCYILLQKGLLPQCEKRINTFSKMAEEMNHYPAQLQIQNLLMAVKARKYYRQIDESALDSWKYETTGILNSVKITTQYKYLSSKVYKLQYDAGSRGQVLASKMHEIVRLPEFNNEKNANTPDALLDFLQVKALYHFTNGEPDKAAKFNERFLKLLDEQPLMLQLNVDRYFSVLNNFLIDCLVLKNYTALESGLEKLRTLPNNKAFKKLSNFDANVFRLGYLLELNYLISTGKFEHAYIKIKPIQQGLTLHGNKVVKHNRFTLQYLMAYVCFALAKYDEALDNLWPILQEKESSVAQDIQLAAKMMQLLCHFEKGDKLLLESLIKSLRRVLPAAKDTTSMQRSVISFISSSLRKQNVDSQEWEKLQVEIEKLSKSDSVKATLNLFNYKVWINAHLTSKTFSKVWE